MPLPINDSRRQAAIDYLASFGDISTADAEGLMSAIDSMYDYENDRSGDYASWKGGWDTIMKGYRQGQAFTFRKHADTVHDVLSFLTYGNSPYATDRVQDKFNGYGVNQEMARFMEDSLYKQTDGYIPAVKNEDSRYGDSHAFSLGAIFMQMEWDNTSRSNIPSQVRGFKGMQQYTDAWGGEIGAAQAKKTADLIIVSGQSGVAQRLLKSQAYDTELENWKNNGGDLNDHVNTLRENMSSYMMSGADWNGEKYTGTEFIEVMEAVEGFITPEKFYTEILNEMAQELGKPWDGELSVGIGIDVDKLMKDDSAKGERFRARIDSAFKDCYRAQYLQPMYDDIAQVQARYLGQVSTVTINEDGRLVENGRENPNFGKEDLMANAEAMKKCLARSLKNYIDEEYCKTNPPGNPGTDPKCRGWLTNATSDPATDGNLRKKINTVKAGNPGLGNPGPGGPGGPGSQGRADWAAERRLDEQCALLSLIPALYGQNFNKS